MTVPRKYRKLFQDAIVVTIPLDVTADFGVAIKRTRVKRIEALYRHFPSLKKKERKTPTTTTMDDNKEKLDDDQDNDDDDDEEEALVPKNNKQRPNLHQPQREQYGSVLDYLEAKYVMGVTVPSSEGEDDDEEEDRGSVYSEGSFLDDTQLKSELAEQVLSQKTQTKVGVENQDDDDFFVNVGNLEVEEHDDLMDYDPLRDEQEEKEEKQQVKKKRRRSTADASKGSTSAKSTTTSKITAKKKKTDSSSKNSVVSDKTALPVDRKEQDKEEEELRSEEYPKSLLFLKQETVDKQASYRELYDMIVKRIKSMSEEELPRRKKTSKVSVVVSDGKEPGDTITFQNPHIPGQRLQVKVPKGLSAGSKFIVSVPAPAVVPDEGDSNKWGRDFQELVSDYSAAYDEWCQAEVEYREAAPDIKEKFFIKKKKFEKFDELVKEFPSDLVTSVDTAYLKNMARRARQNKQKRVRRPGGSPVATSSQKTEPKKKETVEPQKEQVSETVEIKVPGKGSVFPKRVLIASEFEA